MKKIFWFVVAALTVTAVTVAFKRPDWVVVPPNEAVTSKAPTSLKSISNALATIKPLTTDLQSQATVQPTTQPSCDQTVNVYCYGVYGVDQYGTPIPKVQVTQPAQPWVRSDGYFNYCYQMPDGSWTTVIGLLTLGPGVYYYGGSIDAATQAPAYADQSEAWCAANVPS